MARKKVPRIRRKNIRRSRAAIKGWNTRIRKQGIKQLINTTIGQINPVNKVKITKDITIGLIKTAKPDLYRKHQLLKKLDKL